MNTWLFTLSIVAIVALPILGTLFFFWTRSREDIIKKYAGSSVSRSLFVKKYEEASVSFYKPLFLLIGFVVTLSALLMAFNYSPPQRGEVDLVVREASGLEIENIPQTNQIRPPKPPPPPPPEVIEVRDELVVDATPEVLELEFDMEEVIEEPVYVPPPVEEPQVGTEPEEPDFFVVVEEMPEFPGGLAKMYEFLRENIQYPQVAKDNSIEGKVYLRFIVDEKGRISNVVVLRSVGGGCDEEALRVVKAMPRWKPGRQRGKPVRVQYTLPVHFELM